MLLQCSAALSACTCRNCSKMGAGPKAMLPIDYHHLRSIIAVSIACFSVVSATCSGPLCLSFLQA
jgi:hypothetical protein